jgi:hypothetical protein
MNILYMINDLQELAFKYILDKYPDLEDQLRDKIFQTEFDNTFKRNIVYTNTENLKQDMAKYALGIAMWMEISWKLKKYTSSDEEIMSSKEYKKFTVSVLILYDKLSNRL